MADLTALERLVVVQECTQLIARFAERTDARDSDALAEMFVADGVYARPTAPDQPIRGREIIRERFAARPADKLTRHVVANTAVTPLGPAEAEALSYILLFTATLAGGDVPPVKADAGALIGAFRDRIVRDRDGVWKFKERIGSLAMKLGG